MIERDRSARLAVFGVVAALAFCLTAMFGLGELRGNEYDILPAAKQLVDQSWLASDWYLNLPIQYRYAFAIPVGLALKVWSFGSIALVGRALVFVFFSAACVSLCRACRVTLWLCVPWILLFLPKQSLVAGEWIIQALETKPFAYASALFALACLVRRRYAAMGAWLGAAVSMHWLVGFYASVCSLSCLLLREHRQAWTSVFRWAPWSLVTGLPGLATLLAHLLRTSSLPRAVRERGAEIYVTLRVPHHVLPGAWQGRSWPFWLAGCVLLFVALRLTGSERRRTLSQYALTAASLFVTGLVLAYGHDTADLRLYWFRFGDTMLPLLFWFAIMMLLSDAQRRASEGPQRGLRSILHGCSVMVTLAAPLLCAWPYVAPAARQSIERGLRDRRGGAVPSTPLAMHRWIREHTPLHARFLVDPANERFYVEAERSVFVTFKHSPQSEGDIVEWYSRLCRIYDDRAPQSGGYAAIGELSAAYRHLRAERIAVLAREYALDYMLTDAPDLPFPQVHREGRAILYRLTRAPIALR